TTAGRPDEIARPIRASLRGHLNRLGQASDGRFFPFIEGDGLTGLDRMNEFFGAGSAGCNNDIGLFRIAFFTAHVGLLRTDVVRTNGRRDSDVTAAHSLPVRG